MTDSTSRGVPRRDFVAGAGIGGAAVGLGLCHLRRSPRTPQGPVGPPAEPPTSVEVVAVRPVFERLRERLADCTPERAAEISGLRPALIRRFARELAGTPRAMILAS